MLENLMSIAIFGAIIYGFFAFNKKETHEWAEKRRAKSENFSRNRKKLEYTGDSALIRNFVIKYGYIDDSRLETNLEAGLQFFDQLSKLEELLDSKGYTLTENETKLLLKEAYLELKYDGFHEKMLANRPRTIDDCIKNLVDIYGNDYTLYLNDFWKLLGEGEFTYDEEEVRDRISRAIRESKLKRFEDKLKSNDPSYSIEDVDAMSGYEFEGFLKTLFENSDSRLGQK